MKLLGKEIDNKKLLSLNY